MRNGVFAVAIFVWILGFLLSIGVPVFVVYALYEAVLYLKRH